MMTMRATRVRLLPTRHILDGQMPNCKAMLASASCKEEVDGIQDFLHRIVSERCGRSDVRDTVQSWIGMADTDGSLKPIVP